MDRRKNSAVVLGTLAVAALFLNVTTSYAVGQQGIATSSQTTALSAGQPAVLSTPIMIAGGKAFTAKPPTGPNREGRPLLRNSMAWPTVCFEFAFWKYCI
jgi:hypothetical protein